MLGGGNAVAGPVVLPFFASEGVVQDPFPFSPSGP